MDTKGSVTISGALSYFCCCMNYQETLEYLYKMLPMFSRIGPPAFKHDLGNTLQLCESLGNPHQKFKSIHIAGTNGKGSVSHMLAAIFQTAGYKTGLYTSPHLKDFRERIRINGEMISEDEVISFTEMIKPQIEKISPSFFEATVAMAFHHFAKEQVDIAIIETGLGGRLDSTNVITPELSVITNIGMDHMNMLGDTLEKIAFEKAGIIKEAVPVIIGESQPEVEEVFRRTAAEKKAPISFASEQIKVLQYKWDKNLLQIETEDHYRNKNKWQLDLPGIYQTKNLLTVLAACYQLEQLGWDITEQHIREALTQVKRLTGLHGRWEIIHHAPLVVLDVAHNVDGIKQLAEQIKLTNHKHLHIVLGMVKDKDVDEVLKLLPAKASYYFTRSNVPRSLSEEELATKAAVYGLTGKTFPNVNAALYSVSNHATKKDLVMVCGSIFLVGEVSVSAAKAMWQGENDYSGAFDMLEGIRFFG